MVDVEVNGEPILLETAVENFPFLLAVPLIPGHNTVEVVARDLVGNMAKTAVSVIVDLEGPVVEIESVSDSVGGSILLEGMVYDNVLLSSLAINGRSIPLSGKAESRFSVELQGAIRSVLIEAADATGNMTRAHFPISAGIRRSDASLWSQVVPATWSSDWPVMLSAIFQTREPLTIELESIPAEVQQESISISWIINAVSPLSAVKVNEETKTIRQGKAGKPYIFSHILTLREGENVVAISVTDDAGRAISKTVKIIRKIEEINQIGSRLSVAVMPFRHSLWIRRPSFGLVR